MEANFDPKNLVSVMVYICDMFNLSHPQMMALRQKVEAAYHSQPKSRKQAKRLVHLEGIAIAVGLCVGMGMSKLFPEVTRAPGVTAVDEVVNIPNAKIVEVGRQFDPYEETHQTGGKVRSKGKRR